MGRNAIEIDKPDGGIFSNDIFKYFRELSAIPHGSGNEKAISDYLVKFADDRNLWVNQDACLNVVIKKSASIGYENAKPVIIQGHMDMVCEKNIDTMHDFLNDGIKLVVDGDFLKADGTTLGADNGIAIAMALALLDSDKYAHPPLEILLTTNEETGMDGAKGLDGKLLKGQTLINLDNEEEGVFFVSCAGGMRVDVNIPLETFDIFDNYHAFKLSVKGLKGGHSGMMIHLQRGNSNRIMGQLMSALTEKFDLFISNIEGGSKDNAIPREAVCEFVVNNHSVESLKEYLLELEKTFKDEYRISDADLYFELEDSIMPKKVFTKELTDKIMNALALLPCGVQGVSLSIEGLVETSVNIGIVKTKADSVSISSSIRSSVASRKTFVFEQITRIGHLLSAKVAGRGEYPAWEYAPNSELRQLMTNTYKQMYGVEAKVNALHAGLECGVFSEVIGNVDMISFGPNIYDAHTPNEHVSISSILRVWDFLIEVLAKMH